MLDIGHTLPDAAAAATSWGHQRRTQSPPPQQEHQLVIKLEGISEEAANLLEVEVEFEADSSRREMCFAGWKEGIQEARWTLGLPAANLLQGLHLFLFRVCGEKVLSTEHILLNGWNAVLYSDQIRHYILAHKTGSASDVRAPLNHSASLPGGPMLGSKRPGSNFLDDSGVHHPASQGMVRPYSINNLVGMASDDEDQEDLGVGTNNPTNFPAEIFEGLFDAELRLRIDGVVIPEAHTLPAPPRVPLAMPRSGKLRLWAGAHKLKKKVGFCEDAYFVSSHSLGVADGVGCMVQFASYGINAAQYAAELMEQASISVRPGGSARTGTAEERALSAVQAAELGAEAYGASTITVLVQEGTSIGVANLGDSGFMLLRKTQRGMSIVKRSDEQQHSWNCPYQLTRLPPALISRFPKLSLDTAADCEKYSADIREGDLILLFTDGLRDNLHDREVLHIVDCALSPALGDLVGCRDHSTNPEYVARALALAAQERSMDPAAKVPFVEYSKRHGFECLGGKQDDITVVAAWVVQEEFSMEDDEEADCLDVDGLLAKVRVKKAQEAAAQEAAAREAAEALQAAAKAAAEEEAAREAAEEAAREAAAAEARAREAQRAAQAKAGRPATVSVATGMPSQAATKAREAAETAAVPAVPATAAKAAAVRDREVNRKGTRA